MIEIIKTIYTTPKVSPLYKRKISKSFNIKIGLKQDNMHKTLPFNLYINDLPDFLNNEGNTEEKQLHIPKLDNVATYSLLFSDDLSILSWLKYDLKRKISN